MKNPQSYEQGYLRNRDRSGTLEWYQHIDQLSIVDEAEATHSIAPPFADKSLVSLICSRLYLV